MDDHASARLPDRCFDRLQIERQQRAQVDDFSIDAGFGNGRHADIDHRPVGEHGQGRALAPDDGLPQRHGIMTVRNLAEFVFRPRCDGPIVMTVEGAVIEPLRLQEDHRIGILDRCNQQPFGVARVRRHDCLQT